MVQVCSPVYREVWPQVHGSVKGYKEGTSGINVCCGTMELHQTWWSMTAKWYVWMTRQSSPSENLASGGPVTEASIPALLLLASRCWPRLPHQWTSVICNVDPRHPSISLRVLLWWGNPCYCQGQDCPAIQPSSSQSIKILRGINYSEDKLSLTKSIFVIQTDQSTEPPMPLYRLVTHSYL